MPPNTAPSDPPRFDWNPIVILSLVALLVLLGGLYVTERAQQKNTPIAASPPGQSAPAAQPQYQWRMAVSWPKNFPGLGTATENFARYVAEMSNGRLQIQVYGAGELVPALGVFDAVSAGSVEMGHTAAYYHKGKIPAAPFFTAVPFGMNVLEQNAWLYYGGGLELWRDLYEPFGVIPFPGGNTGMQMAGWFNREIRSAADIKGLKMRIPGMAGEVFSRLGGSAIAIPGSELYTAMQTGVIDATEWVGPYNDRAFGLHEVGKHYYYPGWHEVSAGLEFDVNRAAWDSLPTDLQAMIRVAAQAVNLDMTAEYIARNGVALRDLIEQEGIQPAQLPMELLGDLRRVALQYYADQAARDPDFARIYTAYRRFQAETHQWMRMSEQVVFEYREALGD
ncbi:MAG: TRAP transporter substrate-binding protein DctP [Cellvibrionales bacterium]|nr:TRAP transporter substrate-binding protein DctP [Cellvibrionales bacterium]